jgi:hypothetical protein
MNSILVKYILIPPLILLLASSALFAHHGKDFSITETTELPEPKSFWLLLSGDFGSEEQLNNEHAVFEFTPGILYGITKSFAIEAHPHFAKEEHEDLAYEAIGFQLRYNFSSLHDDFDLGIATEYEIASKSEHENLLDLRFIISGDTEKYKFALNSGFEFEEETSFVARFGVGSEITDVHSFAIELLSKFGDETNIDIIPSWTNETKYEHTMRIGLGFSTDKERPRISFRTILIFSL